MTERAVLMKKLSALEIRGIQAGHHCDLKILGGSLVLTFRPFGNHERVILLPSDATTPIIIAKVECFGHLGHITSLSGGRLTFWLEPLELNDEADGASDNVENILHCHVRSH